MDAVINVLNKEIDTSKGEKKVTRSMFIQECVIHVFEQGAKMKIEKTEKEA